MERRGTAPRAARSAPRAAALAAAACLGLSYCGGPKAPPDYPYVADRPRVLFATAGGLSAARSTARAAAGATAAAGAGGSAALSGAGAGAAAPNAAIAHNASVLTSDGRSIVAAVNSFGYARIEAAPREAAPPGAGKAGAATRRGGGKGADGVAYRVVNVSLSSCMEGLTTAGIWPTSRGFLLQLYRDPFFSAAPPLGDAARGKAAAGTRLLEIGAAEGERALPCPAVGESADGYELFALFPSRGRGADARWLGELRREGADSVALAFFEADSPGGGSAQAVGREVFESALAPLPLASLQGLEGAALRSALGALGPGQFMARLRSAEGTDAWYLTGGKPEDAAQAWAWSLGSGRVLALSASGILADAGKGATKAARLGSPHGGASYTALAAAGGIVAAAWEAGSFPEIAAAGLVIAPLGD